MRLVEIRLLDGPNIYRLEPAAKIEVAVGRRRTWYGQRSPGRHAVVRLGRSVRAADAPTPVAELAEWVRTLHKRALDRKLPVAIHRTSEPGHWIVAYPWLHFEEAETVARAAFRLAEDPGERLLKRAISSIRDAGGRGPEWITDESRRLKIISVSGTNGKSTTARMITHICLSAGMRVGTTTTDGVLIDEQMVEPGDYTGPAGARAVFSEDGLDIGVLETARGGILLRGLGYQSNDASVLTNISADHLDLQGVHTLPELAEVKSVICRVTRQEGAVALNADDPLIAGVARYLTAPVFYYTAGTGNRRVRDHIFRGGTAFVVEDGVIVERAGNKRHEVVALADVPTTYLGLAPHNVANALAATAGARALGITRKQIAVGLSDFGNTADTMPGRMNLYVRDRELVVVDYAHNEAGLDALLTTIEGLIGKRGKRHARLTMVIGTAGDRPDDSLRAIGRMAGERADKVVVKETLGLLRGRSRAGMIGELVAGARSAGVHAGAVPDYPDEISAIEAELADDRDTDAPFVMAIMCHEHRDEVRDLLVNADFDPVTDPRTLTDFRD